MEKVIWITLLYDFYGQLLTNRQQKLVQLYYEHDYSLAEIASEHNITRQAVHDTLKRAERSLGSYEEKLGLVDKFMNKHQNIAEALQLLLNFRQDHNWQHLNRVEEILKEALPGV